MTFCSILPLHRRKKDLSTKYMNDYWTTTGHAYHIDLNSIKSLCLQLLCLFEASAAFARRYDISEPQALDEGQRPVPTTDQFLSLHDELINTEATKVMLTLAMVMRVYDDQMKSGPMPIYISLTQRRQVRADQSARQATRIGSTTEMPATR